MNRLNTSYYYHMINTLIMEALIMNISTEKAQTASDEDVLAVSKRLIEKNRKAYKVLAK